jgi:putative transcriptional regulator
MQDTEITIMLLIMIKNNLSKIMGEKRMKTGELQRISGLSKGTIIQIYYNRTTQISFDTLNKLCYALECTAHDIFEYVPD